ncbi:hypothetical protein BYT27DRAFT_7032834, partial [Phlegmacium glaucopus]
PVTNPPPSHLQHAHVEDVTDDDDEPLPKFARYIEPYPHPVAHPLRRGQTKFEILKEKQEAANEPPWAPFESREEWELASWLMKNVGQKSTDEYLKLPIIHNQKNLSFHNNYSFLKKVDQLPTGPSWHCEIIDVVGDKLGNDRKEMHEKVELWRRDPVDCVMELLGNPAFKEFISYTPERVFSDNAGKERIFDEMWTADWWW